MDSQISQALSLFVLYMSTSNGNLILVQCLWLKNELRSLSRMARASANGTFIVI